MAHFAFPLSIGAAILIVCYLVWRFMGFAVLLRSISSWFASQLAVIAGTVLSVAAICKSGCVSILRTGMTTGRSDWQLVGVAIVRLLYLIISCVVLLGEVPLTQFRSVALYRVLVTQLHLPLDIFMGWLWILVPVTWAFLFVEAAGGVEVEESLFPRMRQSKIARWCMGSIAVVFFLASLGLNYYFQAFGQCTLLQIACANDAALQIFIVGGFSIVLVSAGVIAARGVHIGLTSAFSVLLGMLYCVFSLVSLVCGLLSKGFAEFGSQIVGSLNPRSVAPLPSSVVVTTSHYALPVSSQQVSLLIEEEEKKEKDDMAKRQRINSLVCFDTFGYQMGPLLLDAFNQLQGLFTVLAIGLFDHKRPIAKGWSGSYTDIVDISPAAQEIETLRAHFDSEELMHRKATQIMVDRLVQAQASLQVHGNILVPTDLLHIPTIKDALYTMKGLLPSHQIIVVTAIPAVDQHGEQGEYIKLACELLLKMRQEGIIEATILLDLRSHLSAQVGEGFQMKLVAKTLVSLVIASFHHPNNPPFAEVMPRAGALSPFVGVAVESVKIASGKSPAGWSLLRWLKPSVPDRGTGDLNDAIVKSKLATRHVTDVENTQASIMGVDLAQPFFLMYDAPFPDARRHEEYADAMSAYAGREYRKATTMVVRGNGTIDPRLGSGYYVQIASLYPLAPQLFLPKEQVLESVKASKQEPAQQNGHVGGYKQTRQLVGEE